MTLLVLLALAGQVPGSVAIDPALRWYTIETRHFAVHFPSRDRIRPDDTAEELATRVAAACERAHAELVPIAGWQPRGRTDVVVADFFDYSNGWAAPVPRNTITVIPFLPAGDLVAFDDRLHTLIVHEYAHILQLDMVRAFPAFLRHVFGRVVVVGPLEPFWLLEGWAVTAETRFSAFGRARSTWYDLMLRAAADSGRLLPIDRAAHYDLELYPGGNAPYLYGGGFYRWAERVWDDSIWRRFHRDHSGGFPFAVEPAARRVFGRDFPSLWEAWQDGIRRHADSIGRRLEAEGLTPLRRVTAEGWRTGSPCWSADGRELYYLSRDGTDYPAIRALDPASGRSRLVHRGLVTGPPCLAPGGRALVFSERNTWREYYEYDDIWRLDLECGKLERLTNGLRARDPDCAPDGRIAFVLHREMTTDLCLLDPATGAVENLTATTEPTGYSRPRFSPDGRYIAVSVNRPDGRSDIKVRDTRTGWVIPVTDDRAVDIEPCWSHSGRELLFVSDRTGVFNLHAWSPATGLTRRCTNTRWGVFEPAVAPGDRAVAVTAGGPSGFDVALTPYDTTTWLPAEEFHDTLPPPVEPAPTPREARLLYYNPLASLAPALWLPLPLPEDGNWTLGAMTFGWDALQVHRYTAAAGWRTGPVAGPRLLLDYTYSGLRPIIAVDADLALDRQAAGLGAALPFTRTRRVTRVTAGARAVHDDDFGMRWLGGFSTSNAFRYRLDVAPVEGGAVSVAASLENRSAAGIRNRLSALHDFRHWYRLPGHASLRARVAFGISIGDASADSTWRLVPGPATLGIRGFSGASDPARHALAAGAEYRRPLLRVERGIGTLPLYIANLNAAAFAEAGLLWSELVPTLDELKAARTGVGVELRADLIVGHMVPVQVSAGAALGVTPGGGLSHQLYLGMSSSLLAGLLDKDRPWGTTGLESDPYLSVPVLPAQPLPAGFGGLN